MPGAVAVPSRIVETFQHEDACALAHHQGLGTSNATLEDLKTVLERLFGWPIDAAGLETEILPARLDPYLPSWLDALMSDKTRAEARQAALRLALQRLERKYGPQPSVNRRRLDTQLVGLRVRLGSLDAEAGPIATRLATALNETWGPLMSTGLDHSYLAWQVESYADIYTSRVSNLLAATPFAYLRSPRDRMPHDVETS